MFYLLDHNVSKGDLSKEKVENEANIKNLFYRATSIRSKKGENRTLYLSFVNYLLTLYSYISARIYRLYL